MARTLDESHAGGDNAQVVAVKQAENAVGELARRNAVRPASVEAEQAQRRLLLDKRPRSAARRPKEQLLNSRRQRLRHFLATAQDVETGETKGRGKGGC